MLTTEKTALMFFAQSDLLLNNKESSFMKTDNIVIYWARQEIEEVRQLQKDFPTAYDPWERIVDQLQAMINAEYAKLKGHSDVIS